MSILGINVSDRTRTNSGNEYNSTNAGKMTGTVLGTGIAGYTGYKMHNVTKQLFSEDVLELMRTGAKTALEELPEEFKVLPDNLIDTASKSAKKYLNIGTVIFGAAALLSAIGAGALVDGAINKVRAFKADKSNPMLRAEEN